MRRKQWKTATVFTLIGLAPLGGCATAMDNITSRSYRKSLWNNPYQTLFVTPDPLVVLSESTDGKARAKALKRLHEPKRRGGSDTEQTELLAILASAAKTEKQPLVRLAAIEQLGTWQDPRAAQALIQAYQELAPAAAAKPVEDPLTGLTSRRLIRPELVTFPPETITIIQCRTLGALGKTASPEAVAFLGSVARQPLPNNGADLDAAKDIKVAAVRALGTAKDPTAAQTLVTVLRDANDGPSRDVAVRDRTVEALRLVTGKNLPADPEAWQQAVGTQPANSTGNGLQPVSATR